MNMQGTAINSVRALTRKLNRGGREALRSDPNHFTSIKLERIREAKAWLAYDGPKELARMGAMREQAAKGL